MRTLLAILLASALWPAVSESRPRPTPAPATDTLSYLALGYREPWQALALMRRYPAMDSLVQAQWADVVARGERDSIVVARTLVDLVEIATLNGRGREPQLPAQLARAMAIHMDRPGRDSLGVARTLRVSSELHRRRRELEAGERDALRALELFERALGPDHLEVGGAARQVAMVGSAMARGKYVALGQRSVDILRKHYGDDGLRMLSAYSVLAAQQNLAGDQVHALANLERVLELTEKHIGVDHPDADQNRFNVAIVSMRVGDLVRARGLFERVVDWESSRPRVDSLRLGRSVGAYMECLNDLGDHEAALDLYERMGGWITELFPFTDPQHYTNVFELGRTYAGVGRNREAAALFDSTVAFESRYNDSLTAVPILFQRAMALRSAGDSAAAMRGLEVASAMAERAGQSMPSFYELGLLWASSLCDAGRPDEALARLEPCFKRASDGLGPRSPIYAQLLLEQARALAMLRDPRAFDAARTAAELQAELLRTAARGFPDRQALVYARRRGLGLDPLLALAAGGALSDEQRRVTFDRVVDARSLVLDEVGRRMRGARDFRDPVTGGTAQALLDSLVEARAVLARWLVRAEAGREQDSLRLEARTRAERFERALADLRLPSAIASTEPVPARLAAGDALVSYIEYLVPLGGARSERRLLAFVTRAGRAPDVVALGNAAEVEALVARWRGDLARSGASAEPASRASGTRLRARIWDPLASHLAGATRVVLVPDGALHLVDFAALPDARGSYLAESAPLMLRLGAERDLMKRGAVEAQAPERLLAVGGVDFDRMSERIAMAAAGTRGAPVACERFAEVRFAALPGTAPEAESLAARWRAHGGAATFMSGGEAGESNFKHMAPGYTSLHLATHGFFVGGECARPDAASRGIGGMAPAGSNAASTALPVSVSALQLAGLALAGANHRSAAEAGDDGVLTAEEISALDLSAVREVVLSACDTGLGDIAAGEGVLGLQRAFRLAGARALVMSLWAVDDRATREWMSAYYDARLDRHESVAAAVRAASLARLRALRAAHRPTPPAAWAGFIPLGD